MQSGVQALYMKAHHEHTICMTSTNLASHIQVHWEKLGSADIANNDVCAA